MIKDNFSSFAEIYKITLSIAGNKAYLLNKSYMYIVLTYIFQAMAYVLFYPLFKTLLSEEFNFENALFWFFSILTVGLLSFIFRWLSQEFHYSKEFVELTHELRVKLGEKIKNIPLQKLSQFRTGELSSIIVHNVDDSVLHIGVIAGMLLEILIVPTIIIISMLFIEPILAIVFIFTALLIIPLYHYSRNESKLEKSSIMQAHKELESQTIEYFQGLPVLKTMNNIGKNENKLRSSISKVEEIQKKSIFKSIFPLIVMNTLIYFMFVMVLIIDIFFIEINSFSSITLVSFIIIFSRIIEPLSNFLAIAGVLDLIEQGFKSILKILEIEEFKVKTSIKKLDKYDIQFENVSFSYDKSHKKDLENISLKVEENSFCAIVGESGSGKTTLTKLIMGYDRLLEGSIKIGNIDLENINQKDLMSCISVVFQDVYLFDDTIYNNIKMGKSKATKEEITEASKKAYCHDFILKLPNAYETKIGEIGGALSGGERQRISIARAILKDAPIVILDEISSSLDTQSELIVQKAIKELTKFKTVIAISHNLSTINHASNIIVLDKGKILEEGNHLELMNNNGKYYEMYATQQKIKKWNLI